jgi:hypothetical protein
MTSFFSIIEDDIISPKIEDALHIKQMEDKFNILANGRRPLLLSPVS